MSDPDYAEDMIRACDHAGVLRVQRLDRDASGYYFAAEPYDYCELCGENLIVAEVFE